MPAHSHQVLDLTKQQEVTKQHESKEREAEFRRQVAALEKVWQPARRPAPLQRDGACFDPADLSPLTRMQEREQLRYQEEKQLEEQRAQVGSTLYRSHGGACRR